MINDLLQRFNCLKPITRFQIIENKERNLFTLVQIWIETSLIEFFPLVNANFVENESIHKYQYILKNAHKICLYNKQPILNYYDMNLDKLRDLSLSLLNEILNNYEKEDY
jgi:hypothetical protein